MQVRSERLRSSVSMTLIGFAVLLLTLCEANVVRAAEMEFKVLELGVGENCGIKCLNIISAYGEITENSAETFAAFLQQNVKQRHMKGIVLLHSPGGNVVGATKFGKLLRTLGVSVVVARSDGATKLIGSTVRLKPGRCYGACVYVLSGGTRRIVPPLSQVVISRAFRIEAGQPQKPIYPSSPFVEQLRQYLVEMGVSTSVVDFTNNMTGDAEHIVTPSELERWNLAAPRF
jgi:hypothetical protein